jgi:Ras family protein T1
VVELTAAGRAFFRDVFERCDVDDDGVLSVREQEELFSTAPAE